MNKMLIVLTIAHAFNLHAEAVKISITGTHAKIKFEHDVKVINYDAPLIQTTGSTLLEHKRTYETSHPLVDQYAVIDLDELDPQLRTALAKEHKPFSHYLLIEVSGGKHAVISDVGFFEFTGSSGGQGSATPGHLLWKNYYGTYKKGSKRIDFCKGACKKLEQSNVSSSR